MINYSAAKFTHFNEDKSLFHVEKFSRTFMRRKFISCGEKFTHFYEEKSLFHVEKKFISCGEKFTHFHGWFMVLVRQFFDPMVLVCVIASKSVDPKYWVHGIVLLWFWNMVL